MWSSLAMQTETETETKTKTKVKTEPEPKVTYRIELTRNNAAKKPKAESVGLVEPDWDSLVGLASAKLRIRNRKRVRLFVCRNCPVVPPGTEITSKTPVEELKRILADGVMLSVSSKGEDYRGIRPLMSSTATKIVEPREGAKLNPPPRWPYPGSTESLRTNKVNPDPETKERVPFYTPTPCTPICGISFPLLEGNILTKIKMAAERWIPGQLSITETSDGFISLDYKENTIFPELDPDEPDTALIRECRGLILSARTGAVLARRFHKFYNIGERPESRIESLGNLDGAVMK